MFNTIGNYSRKIGFATCLLLGATLLSCSETVKEEKAEKTEVKEPDSMIYGLSCDGSNDSVIVFLPFIEGADPITYNIEDAKAQGHIYGKPEIGDWVGIILNENDSTEAAMVVNLDKLKATWTHEVRPTWKEASKLTARAIRRNFASMPDSLKEAYLVPREYGFTLKRSSKASPVGFVRSSSSLEDDSPVEYPKMKYYSGWKTRNGRLILISTEGPALLAVAAKDDKAQQVAMKETYDTLDFVFMNEDSLVLRNSANEVVSFHRKDNALTANAKAQAAAQKVSENKSLK